MVSLLSLNTSRSWAILVIGHCLYTSRSLIVVFEYCNLWHARNVSATNPMHLLSFNLAKRWTEPADFFTEKIETTNLCLTVASKTVGYTEGSVYHGSLNRSLPISHRTISCQIRWLSPLRRTNFRYIFRRCFASSSKTQICTRVDFCFSSMSHFNHTICFALGHGASCSTVVLFVRWLYIQVLCQSVFRCANQFVSSCSSCLSCHVISDDPGFVLYHVSRVSPAR